MRVMMLTLLGSSFLLAAPMVAAQQGGAADLCQELRAYAEKKASEPPKEDKAGEQGKSAGMRDDSQSSGTQGGGSANRSTSSETSKQASAPPTAPVSSGAAAEPASSGHANSSGDAPGPGLAGGISIQEVLSTTGRGDRQACRDTTQTLRRAGADLPAALIALAAYEPGRRN